MTSPILNKGHVYFGCEEYPTHDNAIVVQESSSGVIDIHLGFLQYHHRYNVTVEIPKLHFKGYDIKAVLDAAEKSVPNTNCKLLSVVDEKDCFVFLVEFFTEKERLVKEEVVFNLSSNSNIKLQFNARVLGPGKGTPLLKNGIKCVGVSHDDLSEASDWQG